MVFCPALLPPPFFEPGADGDANRWRLLSYVFWTMDELVQGEYVFVYLHTRMSWLSRRMFGWLQEVYATMPRAYKKNLKGLCIVHPTRMLRTFFAVCRPFISGKFWRKLHYFQKVQDMQWKMRPLHVELPDLVHNYDRELAFRRTRKPAVIQSMEATGLPRVLVGAGRKLAGCFQHYRLEKAALGSDNRRPGTTLGETQLVAPRGTTRAEPEKWSGMRELVRAMLPAEANSRCSEFPFQSWHGGEKVGAQSRRRQRAEFQPGTPRAMRRWSCCLRSFWVSPSSSPHTQRRNISFEFQPTPVSCRQR